MVRSWVKSSSNQPLGKSLPKRARFRIVPVDPAIEMEGRAAVHVAVFVFAALEGTGAAEGGGERPEKPIVDELIFLVVIDPGDAQIGPERPQPFLGAAVQHHVVVTVRVVADVHHREGHPVGVDAGKGFFAHETEGRLIEILQPPAARVVAPGVKRDRAGGGAPVGAGAGRLAFGADPPADEGVVFPDVGVERPPEKSIEKRRNCFPGHETTSRPRGGDENPFASSFAGGGLFLTASRTAEAYPSAAAAGSLPGRWAAVRSGRARRRGPGGRSSALLASSGVHPRRRPGRPRAWRDQRQKGKRSRWRQILPSRNSKLASITLCTFRPVVLKVYHASQWALPVVSSARMSPKVILRSLPREISIAHMSPISLPSRPTKAGSSKRASGW